MDKNMRAGFAGKKDAMRDLADKLMKGGKSPKKFAAGGVAKIRHKQATKSGAPLPALKSKRGCNQK